MCGIVGVLSTEAYRYDNPNTKFFKQALFADTLRGADSSGIAVMELKDDYPLLYKKALSAPDFLQLKQADDILDVYNDWNIMIGHNRAATKGGVTDLTSHPFQIGDITLVHNGTINNHQLLPDGKDFTVDSEAITHAINKVGIAEVVQEIDGAFTLVWYDARDKSVNFIRNKERPLHIGITKDKDTILFASEGSMLKWIAIRNGIELESIIQPNVGFHYKYIVGAKDWATTPEVKELPLAVPFISGGSLGKKTGGGVTTFSNNTVSAAIYSKFNLSGGEVAFIPYDFAVYKQASSDGVIRGMVSGYLPDTTEYHQVRMHAVSEKDYDDIGDRYILAGLRSACMENGNAVIYADSSDYIAYSEDERGTEEDETTFVQGPHKVMISLKTFDLYTKHGCEMCEGNVFPEDAAALSWTTDGFPICRDCTDRNAWGQ